MDKILESALIAGNLVKFVYLDPEGNEAKDREFTARCHFLPRIGDKIKIGADKQIAFVKSIYHCSKPSSKQYLISWAVFFDSVFSKRLFR